MTKIALILIGALIVLYGVTLIATDRAALIDVPHFCAESGHILIETRSPTPTETEFTVERGPDA